MWRLGVHLAHTLLSFKHQRKIILVPGFKIQALSYKLFSGLLSLYVVNGGGQTATEGVSTQAAA